MNNSDTKREFRVLHIFSGFGGGISSLIINLIENKAQDFTFDTMAFSYKNGDHFVKTVSNQGGKCFVMPRPRMDGYRAFRSFVNKVLEETRYDAVHCHISGWMILPFAKAARKKNVNTFVIHAHSTIYDNRISRIALVNRLNKRINYKYATQYMICSDMAGEYIFGKKYIQKKETKLVPNGMRESYYAQQLLPDERASFNEEFSIPQGAIVFAHVGRFAEQKNHEFIIKIAEELSQKNINYVLLFCGVGERLDEIKTLVEKTDFADKIRFLGHRLDVPKIMQYSDCMILPSFYEGLPTVAIECQASATHILCSETITPQCDMGLGLLEFLPIDSAKLWGEKIIEKSKIIKPEASYCIKKIKEQGFTAGAAGQDYCAALRRYIFKNEEK